MVPVLRRNSLRNMFLINDYRPLKYSTGNFRLSLVKLQPKLLPNQTYRRFVNFRNRASIKDCDAQTLHLVYLQFFSLAIYLYFYQILLVPQYRKRD